MKQFFKYVFASALGFILGGFLLIAFVVMLIGAVVGSLSSDTTTDVKDQSVLELKFESPLTERTSKNPLQNLGLSGLGDLKALGLNDILKNIDKAKRDPRISGIFLNTGSIPAAPATIEEIRNALIDFKTSKKFIYAYSDAYTLGGYYLATAADKIYLHPEGILDFRGMHTELMFFKGALDKLEIEPQVIRHGKFKSAVEPYIMDKMSPENKEQLHALIDGIWSHVKTRISKERNIPTADLQLMADRFIAKDPDQARQAKLVDKVCYYDEFLTDMHTAAGWPSKGKERFVSVDKYDNAMVSSEKAFSNSKIALIYAVGEIQDGKGNDQVIGGNTTAAEIRKARLDTSIKAIVLRVNSPGGSALASDIIWREVTLARKSKPVIASMGDYAASGGYYISCAADSIIAENTTITGSIGVFGLMFNAQKMFNNKLGITFDTINTGHFSDLGSMTRPMRPDEKELLQVQIEHVYDGFISKVAAGRRMAKAAVDSIGQGRVWNGDQALTLGLIDRKGNLKDAVDMAARMAKVDNYRVVELPRQKELIEQLMEDFSTGTETYFAKRELGDSYRYYEAVKKAVLQQGVLARMPYEIEIR